MDTLLSARSALLQALEVPGFGLELIERVRRRSGGAVRLRMGSVYPALQGLEGQGLVRARPVRAAGRGRPRRYYELTLDGVQAARSQRDALLGMLRPTVQGSPTRPEVDAMRRRLEECSDVSGAVLELQRRMQQATGRGR
jgi:DNA-binding PadR family transcriptional regulator